MSSLHAHARRSWGALAVLGSSAALLFWVAFTITDGESPDYHGRGSWIGGLPTPAVRAVLILAALLCLLGLIILVRRGNRLMVIVDESGVTSHSGWGRGTLAWDRIEQWKVKGSWLELRGTSATDGGRVKLMVPTQYLDVSGEEIMAALHHHSPDRFPDSEASEASR